AGQAMPRPFPAQAQSAERAANALAGGIDGMVFSQVALEQRSSPDCGAIAVVARIIINNGLDERIDNSQSRCWPTSARSIQQALGQVSTHSVLKRLGPIVDGLPADIEEIGRASCRERVSMRVGGVLDN